MLNSILYGAEIIFVSKKLSIIRILSILHNSTISVRLLNAVFRIPTYETAIPINNAIMQTVMPNVRMNERKKARNSI